MVELYRLKRIHYVQFTIIDKKTKKQPKNNKKACKSLHKRV